MRSSYRAEKDLVSSPEAEIDSSSNVDLVDQGALGIWQEAIRQVATQQSRSIAMNQPVASGQLNDLAAASETVELLLDQGNVDDAGMTLIAAHLPNLEHLRIRLSQISDTGAEALAELDHLRILNIPQGRIGAKSIRSWNKLPQLEHVRLGGSQVDDAAMEALAALPNLQSLHLIGPNISDEGLQYLERAKKLSSLYVDDCQVSEQAWQQLRNSRPDLHVHLDQQHRDRKK